MACHSGAIFIAVTLCVCFSIANTIVAMYGSHWAGIEVYNSNGDKSYYAHQGLVRRCICRNFICTCKNIERLPGHIEAVIVLLCLGLVFDFVAFQLALLWLRDLTNEIMIYVAFWLMGIGGYLLLVAPIVYVSLDYPKSRSVYGIFIFYEPGWNWNILCLLGCVYLIFVSIISTYDHYIVRRRVSSYAMLQE